MSCAFSGLSSNAFSVQLHFHLVCYRIADRLSSLQSGLLELQVKPLALSLAAKAWRPIKWREGSAGSLACAFGRRIASRDHAAAASVERASATGSLEAQAD